MPKRHPLSRACDIAGSQAALSRKLNVTPSLINQWIAGTRPVPDKSCVEIEKITNGKVLAGEINTKTKWVRVADFAWPHPGGRPCVDHGQPTALEVAVA